MFDMKKKIIWICLIILFITAAIIIYFHPCSFDAYFRNVCDIHIIVVHQQYEDKEWITETEEYECSEQQIHEIMGIMQDFSYRRLIPCVEKAEITGLEGTDSDDIVTIYLGNEQQTHSIVCGGNQKIEIDGKVYRLDHPSKKRSVELIESLLNLMKE